MLVTHNLAQAKRVADFAAFFWMCASISQGGYQWTAHLSFGRATLRHQRGQRRFDARQIGQLATDVDEFVFGEGARLIAMRAIFQLQQLADLVEAEAKLLRGLDEAQVSDVGRRVTANAAIRLVRFKQQPFALIKTDGLDADPDRRGEGPNREIFKLFRRGA